MDSNPNVVQFSEESSSSSSSRPNSSSASTTSTTSTSSTSPKTQNVVKKGRRERKSNNFSDDKNKLISRRKRKARGSDLLKGICMGPTLEEVRTFEIGQVSIFCLPQKKIVYLRPVILNRGAHKGVISVSIRLVSGIKITLLLKIGWKKHHIL